jgi:hypothetical protein
MVLTLPGHGVDFPCPSAGPYPSFTIWASLEERISALDLDKLRAVAFGTVRQSVFTSAKPEELFLRLCAKIAPAFAGGTGPVDDARPEKFQDGPE